MIEQLEGLGFSFLPEQKVNSSDISYFVCNGSRGTDVESLLAVRYLSRTQRYEFDFGFNASSVRSFFAHQMPYLPFEIRLAIDQMNKERPACWFTWPLIWDSINYRLNLSTKEPDLPDIFSGPFKLFMEQVLLSVRSEEQLLDIYLSNIPPFEWRYDSSHFARFCQIAYLVSSTKSRFELAERCLSDYYRFMQASDLYGSELKVDFFQELLEFIQRRQ
ncbi:hypothetical protein G5B88_17560 [Herbaspirillum seropedicae]|uniref:hypothetical protein n=1 Tax=Herbaspirillum seropedicae TaxID=964 RepID=UPI0012E2FCAF|nr:hypothetical protein [Herbaspirillum seropedicae]UMU22835.1 hypothetical protein G5B88_17560 [Herbaspirillum seropedicae]